MSQKTIGFFHQFEANRKGYIKMLTMDTNLCFEEINHWKKMETSLSDIIVVFSPIFLPSEENIEGYKEFFQRINKTLIIVSYFINEWIMDRKKTFYLDCPNEKETLEELCNILRMETMNRSAEYIHVAKLSSE